MRDTDPNRESYSNEERAAVARFYVRMAETLLPDGIFRYEAVPEIVHIILGRAASLGISEGTVTAPPDVFIRFEPRFRSIAQCLDELATASGCHWYVKPSGAVDFVARPMAELEQEDEYIQALLRKNGVLK
jgi:hypothetical protein